MELHHFFLHHSSFSSLRTLSSLSGLEFTMLHFQYMEQRVQGHMIPSRETSCFSLFLFVLMMTNYSADHRSLQDLAGRGKQGDLCYAAFIFVVVQLFFSLLEKVRHLLQQLSTLPSAFLCSWLQAVWPSKLTGVRCCGLQRWQV